jgi:hypothetical protein
MASDSATSTTETGTADGVLQSLIRGKRGEALRAQLGARYPDSPADAIEEAIQYACKSFLDEAEGITAPGQVYAWIRTAALRSLGRGADRSHREVAVDSIEDGLDRIGAEDAGPVEELIALEDDADLEMLVGEVAASLPDRKRDVLSLYGAAATGAPRSPTASAFPSASSSATCSRSWTTRGRPWPGLRGVAASTASRWSRGFSSESRRPTSRRRRASIFPAAGRSSFSGQRPGQQRADVMQSGVPLRLMQQCVSDEAASTSCSKNRARQAALWSAG